MQRLSSLASPSQSADFLSTLHHATHTLLAPRYIGFLGGGLLILLFVAAAMVENSAKPAPAALQHSDTTQDHQVQTTINTDSPPSVSSNQTKTQLQVNGQDVPVPQNSDTTQTVTDGTTKTIVHTSQTSTQNSNTNSSDLTINVDSVTSGGT